MFDQPEKEYEEPMPKEYVNVADLRLAFCKKINIQNAWPAQAKKDVIEVFNDILFKQNKKQHPIQWEPNEYFNRKKLWKKLMQKKKTTNLR